VIAWRDFRAAQGAGPADPFLCSQDRRAAGKQLDRFSARARFRTACRVLGRERVSELSTPAARHSGITHWLRGGRSLPEVRNAAGHPVPLVQIPKPQPPLPCIADQIETAYRSPRITRPITSKLHGKSGCKPRSEFCHSPMRRDVLRALAGALRCRYMCVRWFVRARLKAVEIQSFRAFRGLPMSCRALRREKRARHDSNVRPTD
jgi:hypothetical protein